VLVYVRSMMNVFMGKERDHEFIIASSSSSLP
jgi:hypothetical protein